MDRGFQILPLQNAPLFTKNRQMDEKTNRCRTTSHHKKHTAQLTRTATTFWYCNRCVCVCVLLTCIYWWTLNRVSWQMSDNMLSMGLKHAHSHTLKVSCHKKQKLAYPIHSYTTVYSDFRTTFNYQQVEGESVSVPSLFHLPDSNLRMLTWKQT